jgi:transketolase
MLAADAVEEAKSGHPGMPMGAAAMAYVLWTKFLRHNPRNPAWPGRDRFVLSAGHGSMLLYGLLHLTGYQVSLEDIKSFRQWGSLTPGHPEWRHTPGVETTTGPLGQGVGNAVGMAMAAKFMDAHFPGKEEPLFDNKIYVLAGDGDMMEGVSQEAASLAGHLGLDNLICLYDNNEISIEGSTNIAFTEQVGARFAACGWKVLQVQDGNDLEELEAALARAQQSSGQPVLIDVKTQIGYGSPGKANTAAAHGEPLGTAELARTKEALGWPQEPRFLIPEAVRGEMGKCLERGEEAEKEWQKKWDAFASCHPEAALQCGRWLKGELPIHWDADVIPFAPDAKGQATRAASGIVLNWLAATVPNLLGGSADLAPSNKTYLSGCGDFQQGSYEGRNLHFGVREHAMGSILNGLALFGGLRPYGATFLSFADYMRPAIRLAALMKLPVVYVFTHDSIGVGEDGPTHQPVEHLASLRCLPGLAVVRPADANETAAAWRYALRQQAGPVALVLSRQNLPVMEETTVYPEESVARGAYVLHEGADRPELIIIASGSEVSLALQVAKTLECEGRLIRVVSMPCQEWFALQPVSFQQSVLPAGVPRMVVEAASSFGWERYGGADGMYATVDGFGASAPAPMLFEHFGLTVECLTVQARRALSEK